MVSTQEKGHTFYFYELRLFQKEKHRERKYNQAWVWWAISDKQEKPSVKLPSLIFQS